MRRSRVEEGRTYLSFMSAIEKIADYTGQFIGEISHRAVRLEEQLAVQSERFEERLRRLEGKPPSLGDKPVSPLLTDNQGWRKSILISRMEESVVKEVEEGEKHMLSPI